MDPFSVLSAIELYTVNGYTTQHTTQAHRQQKHTNNTQTTQTTHTQTNACYFLSKERQWLMNFKYRIFLL